MATTYYYSVNGNLLGEATGGVETTYVPDALGSTTQTITGAGLQNQYAYSPYGKIISRSGTAADPKFLWNGRTQSRTTGCAYAEQYNRMRTMSTTTARWTTRDPLWPDQRAYGYAAAMPVTGFDPYGLYTICMGSLILTEEEIIQEVFCELFNVCPPPRQPYCFQIWLSRGGDGTSPYTPPPPPQPPQNRLGKGGSGSHRQVFQTISQSSNCAGAALQLMLCLGAQTVDLLGDFLFRLSPWRPPSVGPEPPPPILLPPTSCAPPKYQEPIDKGRTIGGNIGYPIAKYAQCWIDFYNECYGGDTEPWQQCCEATDGEPMACEKCCFDRLGGGIPAYYTCQNGCNNCMTIPVGGDGGARPARPNA